MSETDPQDSTGGGEQQDRGDSVPESLLEKRSVANPRRTRLGQRRDTTG